MAVWPAYIPLPEFWKLLTDKHKKEALFTIYRMATYEDLYKWMGMVDPLTPEVRMEVLRNIKFVRKIYLACLRFRGDNEWAEESESGEMLDEFDERVMEQPDPIEWDSLSENQQNMILGYITTKNPDTEKLEQDLVNEKPVSDLEKIMTYTRFSKYIFIQVNMLRERLKSDEEFAKIFTYCLSDHVKEPPQPELENDPGREAIQKNREAWHRYIRSGEY